MIASLALSIVSTLAPAGPPPAPSSASEHAFERVLQVALGRVEADLAELDLWQDHSRWEDPWIHRSAHYEVRTTDSWFLARDIAEGLEVMLANFQDVLGTDFTPHQPFPIWIFPEIGAYNAFGQNEGDEHSSMLGAFFAPGFAQQPVATYLDRDPTRLRMWITHAATHQFVLAAFGRQPPTAVSEGLASYFSLYWSFAYGAKEHQRLRGQYVPLDQLLGEGLGSYLRDPHARLIELGMLFTYLLHNRPDTAVDPEGGAVEASFRDYVRALVRGQDVSHLPFHEYVTDFVDALQADFVAFDFPI